MSTIVALLGLGAALYIGQRYSGGARIVSPIFMLTAVHLLYVFPKVISLSTSETNVAQYFQSTGVDLSVSLAAVSSYLAFILSYRAVRPSLRTRHTFQTSPEELKSLTVFGSTCGLVGVTAFILLAARNGGLTAHFTEFTFYQMELSGINVWLIFVSRFVYPAMAALAIAAMAKPTKIRVAALIAVSAFPALNIIILFRRSDLLFVGYILIYALTVVRGVQISRIVVFLSALAVAVSIIAFPYLRLEGVKLSTGATLGPSEYTLMDQIADTFQVQENDEIVRAAAKIEVVQETWSLEYGAFVWNSLISQFVPSSLFGSAFKQSLLLRSAAQPADGYFDNETFYYVAPFGFAEAVEQLGVFFWVIFVAFGLLTAFVERKANSPADRVFFVLIVPIMCLAATNDISTVPAKLVTFWLLTRFIIGRRSKRRLLRSNDPCTLSG